MNEQDWADRFSHDVDSLLNEAGRTNSEPLPAGYRQALDLAHTLATTDFSSESQVRHALRHRLLSGTSAQEEWRLQKEYVMRTFFQKRRTAVILASAILAALLVVTLAWPDALTAAAQGIYDVIQHIVVGPHTQAVQIDPQTKSEPRPLPADMWIIRTDIGNFGGNAPPGVEPTVRTLTSFEEVQAATNFHLRMPADLPEGYALREVKLAPIGGTAWAILFYGGSGHDIILAQMPGGPQPSDDPNVAVSVASGFITDGTLEEVRLDGRPAVWADGHSLMWEADSVSYMLGGLDLSLEEAIRIAESLE